MIENLSAILYLVSSVCFIMALRGLSSPDTARRGNLYGIIGMVIAIGTTVATPGVVSYEVIIAGILIGGAIGTVIALKIQMTDLPQLVAGFHSLVGLAACFVAIAAYYSPEAYGIGAFLSIKTASIIEMTLGLAIGAITFTGSIVAFGKLQGLISGAPLVFRGQHVLNAALGLALVGLIALLVWHQSQTAFWAILLLSLVIGVLIIMPIGGADMPVVISMLNSYSGWTDEESAPLLNYLYDHATRPEFTCRFRWEAGSIAFWDNRATWHRALNDYQGERRLMHRITVEGKPLR